jgi:hypothetical protein
MPLVTIHLLLLFILSLPDSSLSFLPIPTWSDRGNGVAQGTGQRQLAGGGAGGGNGSTVVGHRLLMLVTLLYSTTLPPLPSKTTAVASSHMRFICSLSMRGVATGTSHMRLAYAAAAIFFVRLCQMWHLGCYGI